MTGRVAGGEITTERPPEFVQIEDCDLAFIVAMKAWEDSVLNDRDRVIEALAAYQKQLDACVITKAVARERRAKR